MNVISIGTDIIEVDRIQLMIQKHGDTFFDRVFTDEEVRYCNARALASQHFAGRWAAKEAVLKVLGTGWAKGIKWTEMEVQNLASGKPIMQLSGKAAEVAQEIGVARVLISISHTRQHAIAYAIGLG